MRFDLVVKSADNDRKWDEGVCSSARNQGTLWVPSRVFCCKSAEDYEKNGDEVVALAKEW